MTDFEKAGILAENTGKDCYISMRYRISSEMRSVNGGGIMLHAERPGGLVAAAKKNAPPMARCCLGTGRRVYGAEFYAAVRLVVVEEGLSHHETGRRFGIDRRTAKKMLSYSAPPGCRRTKPVQRTKVDGFTGIIDAILVLFGAQL